uniref:ankyrin repeat and SOCS box protein 2-like n=1 Tax=Myxine glutinosa TaxID=7769 RepID=UPI00358F828D
MSAGLASGRAAPCPSVDDYDLYGDLEEEELIAIAVEQSLERNSAGTESSSTRVQECGGLRERVPLAGSCSGSRDRSRAHRLHCAHVERDERTAVGEGERVHNHEARPTPCSHKPPYSDSAFTLLWARMGESAQERTKMDPLWRAIQQDDSAALYALEAAGTDLGAVLPNGLNSLHEAAWQGSTRCLRILLKEKKELVNCRSKGNDTPLTLAVSAGQTECMKMLLAAGSATEYCNSRMLETPLYKVCEGRNIKAAGILLSHGAKANARNHLGNTPLYEAVSKGSLPLAEMLLANEARLDVTNKFGVSPLFIAAQCGCLDIVKLFVSRGANVNTKAKDGATALYEACKNGHDDLAVFLFQQGADPNLPTMEGLLPLHAASKSGCEDVTSLLLPVSCRDIIQKSGLSPVHLATANVHHDLLAMLLSAGLSANSLLSPDRSMLYEDRRVTPLMFAVAKGDQHAARLLLSAGAEPVLDPLPPLLVAVRRQDLAMVCLLHDYGADLNQAVTGHDTAFPPALMFCTMDLHTMHFLLRLGCNARACFSCSGESTAHLEDDHSERDASQAKPKPRNPLQAMQFCEVLDSMDMRPWAGPIVKLLLEFVGNIRLCVGLRKLLSSQPGGVWIQDMADNPRLLAHLCRLKIRGQLGQQRMHQLHALAVPQRIRNYLDYSGV